MQRKDLYAAPSDKEETGMRTLNKTSLGLIAALAALMVAPIASAHGGRDWDRDHGRGHGRGHHKHERHWDNQWEGYRVAPRPVVVRERVYVPPPRPVVVRERAYYYQQPAWYAPAPVYAGGPAITIGVNVPPIVIPLR